LFSAILLLDLQLPAYVRLGETAKLVCVYDLEFDGFYRLTPSTYIPTAQEYDNHRNLRSRRRMLKKTGEFFRLVSNLFCVLKRVFVEPCKMFLCSKLSCLGWRSAGFLQCVLSPKIFASPVPTYLS
jgi:hypothetical protein